MHGLSLLIPAAEIIWIALALSDEPALQDSKGVSMGPGEFDLVSAWLAYLVYLLAVIVLLVWICVPFAVFGIKPMLRELITLQKRSNDLLEIDERRRHEAMLGGAVQRPARAPGAFGEQRQASSSEGSSNS